MNNYQKLILIITIILGSAFVYLYSKDNRTETTTNVVTSDRTTEDEIEVAREEDCKPTFSGGGGPYYISNSPFREKIVPEDNSGEEIIVEGQVLYEDCSTPISGAVIDIWQADETGEYRDEWYRGKVTADDEGYYRFETVIPQGYGEGTGYRPPHIHFKIWKEDEELITSQMFFPGAEEREGFDPAYIMEVEENANDSDEQGLRGYHDIILPIRN